METKLFELRDAGTFIPIIATLMANPTNKQEEYLLQRAGYNIVSPFYRLVLLGRMEGGQSSYSPFGHSGGPRTLPTAHLYIQQHWDELTSGRVIDVEFILGEKPAPKKSEALTT